MTEDDDPSHRIYAALNTPKLPPPYTPYTDSLTLSTDSENAIQQSTTLLTPTGNGQNGIVRPSGFRRFTQYCTPIVAIVITAVLLVSVAVMIAFFLLKNAETEKRSVSNATSSGQAELTFLRHQVVEITALLKDLQSKKQHEYNKLFEEKDRLLKSYEATVKKLQLFEDVQTNATNLINRFEKKDRLSKKYKAKIEKMQLLADVQTKATSLINRYVEIYDQFAEIRLNVNKLEYYHSLIVFEENAILIPAYVCHAFPDIVHFVDSIRGNDRQLILLEENIDEWEKDYANIEAEYHASGDSVLSILFKKLMVISEQLKELQESIEGIHFVNAVLRDRVIPFCNELGEQGLFEI